MKSVVSSANEVRELTLVTLVAKPPSGFLTFLLVFNSLY